MTLTAKASVVDIILYQSLELIMKQSQLAYKEIGREQDRISSFVSSAITICTALQSKIELEIHDLNLESFKFQTIETKNSKRLNGLFT